MANLPLDKVKKFYYNQKLSAKEIGKRLNVSQDVIYDFMRKYDLPRRSHSENDKIIFDRKPLTFKIKKKLTSQEKDLKLASLMLYWAEGHKAKKEDKIDFANSDVRMIKIFVKFLNKICQVNKSKLRVYLYCYSNQNVEALKKFWSKETKIPLKQFSKPYVRKDFKMKNNRQMKYGLAHIRYFDTKLFRQIALWTNEYISNFLK